MSLPAAPWLTAAAALVLFGCANLSTREPVRADRSFDARAAALNAVTHWEMRGRIAVDTGEDAWQGRFNWWQEGETLRLVIRGPVGGRAVEITGDGNTLTVRARRETHVLSDPEAQLSELLGWWMPISSLPSWLLGLPDERFSSSSAVLRSGLLRGLEQRDWVMRYGDYARHDTALIPAGITFVHPPLELVVTIDDWSPMPGSSLELDSGRRAQ
ncbi:MAG: lipoprotein insertase outer membrane protein LolB [Gammaproteobacteria bacterium]|jgi:outer membrane lipoprotein LolB